MTIRQVHYTSCRQGRDGIDGFQVAASTVGLAPGHERVALPLAAYRPPPDAPTAPTAEQVAAFPVTLGYRRFDDFAVLFHSRYVGTDFTGRQGNYFAHILVLDRPGPDLAGLRPPEAWASPAWISRPTGEPDLPVLEVPPSGPLADRDRVHDGLARIPAFPTVLDAVVRALQGGPRILLVAADTNDVATVLAAVSRSLPAPMALGLSFTTFTASPLDSDLLVVGTTPAVNRSPAASSGRIIIRLDESPARTAPYAALAARCWAAGSPVPDGLLALAEHVDPPLQPEELDLFAPFGRLLSHGGDEGTALAAVEFAGRRYPTALASGLWRNVEAAVPSNGVLSDVARWSTAVRSAGRQAASGPGPVFEAAYLRAVLADVVAGQNVPVNLWLPTGSHVLDIAGAWAATAVREDPTLSTASRVLGTLGRLAVEPSDPQLREIADLVVIPHLVDPAEADAAHYIRTMPHRRRLLSLASEQLEPRLADEGLFDAATRGLSTATAELLLEAAQPGSRCETAARVALARAGQIDRVSLLREIVGQGDAHRLGWITELLWPDLPTVGDALSICRSFLPTIVAQSGLSAKLVQRLVIDTSQPPALELGTHETDSDKAATDREIGALARALSAVPITNVLSQAEAEVVRAARLEEMFRDPPEPAPDIETALEAARLADRVDALLGERLADAVARWLLAPQPTAAHAGTLRGALKGPPTERFLVRYGRRLTELLTTAPPPVVAMVLPAVAEAASEVPLAGQLLRTECAGALRDRLTGDLDEIRHSLGVQREALASLNPPGAAGAWPAWWERWRAENIVGPPPEERPVDLRWPGRGGH